MNKMRKIFFEQNITWGKTILLSIFCGIITGIIPLIKILDKTSFHNIAECFEIWVLLAMFINLNSKKPLEAGLKTFVFFLISQPLCYLIQVPFYSDGFEIFKYYTYWAILTVLTFPGSILAWYTKKGNWISALILSVALFLLNYELLEHFNTLTKSFPYQLLAVIFIIFEIILFVNMLFFDKKKRIFLYVVSIITIIFAFVNTTITNDKVKNLDHVGVYVLDDGEYTLIENDEGVDVELEGTSLTAKSKKYGEYTIKLKDENDNIIIFTFKASKNDTGIDKLD